MQALLLLSVALIVCSQFSFGLSEESSNDAAAVTALETDGADDSSARAKRDAYRFARRGMRMLRLGKRDGADDVDEGKLDGNIVPPDVLQEVDEVLREDGGKPAYLGEYYYGDDDNMLQPDEEGGEDAKRSLQMLRLGKRQIPMMRLGKRQIQMLRLGKRQLRMLRLGKRDGLDGLTEEEMGIGNEKRSAKIIGYGKQNTVDDLRLGKREDEVEEEKRSLKMLRLGKRSMQMLRLGKRPMQMLRLGKREDDEEEKRSLHMLRLGKRAMQMLRLGKRPMQMLRLGKREDEQEEDKRSLHMLRLGKRSTE